MRLSIIFDNFGPYHVARVGALAGSIEVTGIELRARSTTYHWDGVAELGISKVTLPDVGGQGRGAREALTIHLERALACSRPDVVAVNGWGDYLAVQSIRWCVRSSVPFVLMSESSALDGGSSFLRDEVKRRLVNLASAALVGGEPHLNYVRELGLAEDCVFTGYNAVDNSFFESESEKWKGDRDGGDTGSGEDFLGTVQWPKPESGHEGGFIQVSPSLPPYFLASNRFVERKNLIRLVEAYYQCSKTLSWPLCILGDGSQKPQLIARCRELGVRVIESAPWEPQRNIERLKQGNTVFLPGFRQMDELPRFYARAGCFIHPALVEPWGLVVNEAMACGLPVLVSDRCGCAMDLVIEGENGFKFDPTNVSAMAVLMEKVAGDAFPRDAFGLKSKKIIEDFSPAVFASGMERAAAKALEIGSKNPGVISKALLGILCRIR